MKKILITALSAAAMVAGTSSTFAQGEVIFNNAAATAVFIQGPSTTNVSVKMYGSAGTYDLGLYLGSAGSTLLSQFTLVDTVPNAGGALQTGPGSALAGLFSGGTVSLSASFPANVAYADIVALWSTAQGGTYAEALAGNGYAGLSAVGSITPVLSPATVPNVFGSGAGQVGSFVAIAPSPEPATIALGGLGAAALLLFRRRK
jgi:hypothetical protein